MAKVTCLVPGVDVDQKPTRIQTEKSLVSAHDVSQRGDDAHSVFGSL